ncbi:DNA polymerase III subunit delta [Desulfothermus sp.]
MREGYFICICPDFEVISDFINNTLKKFSGNWEKKLIWGDEDQSDIFFNYLRSSSLINTKQAIILRRAEKLPKEFWNKLSNFLNKFNPDVCPFICIESEWNKGKPTNIQSLKNKKYYKFAEKRKWIFRHPGVDEQFLTDYINKWSKKNKINISHEVMLHLKEILPKDLSSIKNELKKLETLNKNVICVEDLSVISPSFEYNIFDLINSLEGLAPKDKVWDTIINKEINSHQSIFPILGLFKREVKILWNLLKGESVYLPNWVKTKKINIAKKLGPKKIIEIYNIVLEAELRLKTSNINPSMVFENLVASMQSIFKSL